MCECTWTKYHISYSSTQDGITPLYVASGQGQTDVVNILIRNGADINLASNVHCITVQVSAAMVVIVHLLACSCFLLASLLQMIEISYAVTMFMMQ